MSKINKKKHSPGGLLLLILLGLASFGLLLAFLLRGKNVALFNPKGLIAQAQLDLMLLTIIVLLVIALPTLFLVFFIAWKYRESNQKTIHHSGTRHSKLLDLSMWSIPTAFMLVLAVIMWSATHRLVPQKTIAADAKPIRIQVVSMRWKWLFIYPDYNIATVNFVQVPLDTPVQFDLTADEAPMSSFWIPNLGGQLYSMTGHVNRLNLIADTPGDYPGSSAEINGAGFSGMKFTARASNMDDFYRWVQEVKQSPEVLDTATYDGVLEPSENNSVAVYSAYTKGLYDRVLTKYAGSHTQRPAIYEAKH
ncbi:COX aromatic rich motif-containing protein [Candidatus Saccharibacteria bacterium]|nr:COX aromatic rich motif-containing protein [Candidatus Saccharibacteria bacterium]